MPVIYHDFSLEVFLSEEPAATPWAPVLSEDPIEMGIHELSLRSIGRIKTHHLRVSALHTHRSIPIVSGPK